MRRVIFFVFKIRIKIQSYFLSLARALLPGSEADFEAKWAKRSSSLTNRPGSWKLLKPIVIFFIGRSQIFQHILFYSIFESSSYFPVAAGFHVEIAKIDSK